MAASEAATLFARKAILVAVLLDAFADRAFDAWRDRRERVFGAEDVLAYRAAVAAACPEMAAVFGDVARADTISRIAVRTVKVPLPEYGELSVQDYMVSLYNQNTVQRVMLVGDGPDRPAHPVLRDAIAFWRGQLAGDVPGPRGSTSSP